MPDPSAGARRGGQRERAALGVAAHGPPIAGVDDRAAELMDALVPVLIGWHDAMVETVFDRVEFEATRSLARRTPIPRWLRS